MAASSVPSKPRTSIPHSDGTAVKSFEQMISPSELADRLGVSRHTIVREMEAGRLAYHRIASCRRIKESDAEAYIALRRVGPPAQGARVLRAL